MGRALSDQKEKGMNRIAEFEFVSQEQREKDFAMLPVELRLPRRATAGSAGYDFFAPFDFELAPGETILMPTGVRARIDAGWVMMLYPRSGLGFKYWTIRSGSSIRIIMARKTRAIS